MYDTKTVPATPAWARRLRRASEINGMQLSPQVLSLAEQSTVQQDQLRDFPQALDVQSMSALQYVVDWNYRSILLDTDYVRCRRVALAAMMLRGCDKITILSRPNHYSVWARAIREVWPEDSICVYGNPRYHKDDSGYPEGVSFADRSDASSRWQITSYGAFIYNDSLGRGFPDQLIVDELDGDDSYNYRWSNAIAAMYTEVPQILTLFNLRSYQPNDSVDLLGYLQTPGSPLNSYLVTLINECLIPNNSSVVGLYSPSASPTGKDAWDTYTGRTDFIHMLPLLGVCVDLINHGSSNTLSFYDLDFANPKLPSTGGRKQIAAEDSIKLSTGLTMEQLVRTALDDAPLARERLSELKTPSWCSAKSHAVSGVVKQLNSRNNRLLVLAEHPTVFRNLMIQTRCDTLSDTPLLNTTRARFVHPHEEWRSYGIDEIPPPVNVLVLRNLDLVDVPVLNVTTHLVLAEWPHDPQVMQGIRELCELMGIRLVHVSLLNTFEQTLQDVLFRA